MAFLPKKWLRALWGIKAPEAEIEPPAPPRDESLRPTRPSVRPPTFAARRPVEWGGLFGTTSGSLFPRRSKPSLLN